MKISWIALISILLTTTCNGTEQTERMYLRQLLQQIDEMRPIILAARQEQPRNARIKFNYLSFRDYQGKPHHGLLDDINAIEAGIREKLDQRTSEARVIEPIDGDYLNVKTRS